MLKDQAPKPHCGAIPKARKHRRTLSLPEVLLWQELRKRPQGLKFRRQHPSGAYILDFYCADARLAIEVDGGAHDYGDRPQRDAARDAWFARAGIATLRIAARDVLGDLEGAITGVLAACVARLPLHHPAVRGGPPPRDELGEELDRLSNRSD
ncbi:very-short-patch-repair endonuclease [Novosphingobium chloroacetimidivorans]|uniref:Very-short-patch-repair endonuclease n=1 Tax=Novosphingobium chloroacetimidivorans TaxID=1428314 RepID=A0A7W7NX73_9SPHN|nr:endonuclease domain-containing protein [Novosphingobium chloroacetimidivorans]MBB4858832.1 very-short-patch-repair endonuclease [Novosphingobium chloroacetimidivorans]